MENVLALDMNVLIKPIGFTFYHNVDAQMNPLIPGVSKLNTIHSFESSFHFLFIAQTPEFIKQVLVRIIEQKPYLKTDLLLKAMDYLSFGNQPHGILKKNSGSDVFIKKFKVLKELGLMNLKETMSLDAWQEKVDQWNSNILHNHGEYADIMWKVFKSYEDFH